jgi:RNA polymerase sigma-B factor
MEKTDRHPLTTTTDSETDDLFAAMAATSCPKARARIVGEIVERHLGLCDGLAARYANRGIDRDDLVQVARLALVLAITRYQPGRGPSFTAYAVPTISGEVKRHFRDHGWMVRPPRRIQELRAVVRAKREAVEQERGHTPSALEMARELDLPLSDVAQAGTSDTGFRPLSIDAPTTEGEHSLSDSLGLADDELERVADRVGLAAAIRSLEAADRELLWMKFVEGRTQREIGTRLGVSQMQVSRRVRRVIERLRLAMGVECTDEPESLGRSA